MSKLTAKQRKSMPKKDFAIPKKAPGPGSYPIKDRKHGAVALGYAKKNGKTATVKPKVCAKYPTLPSCKKGKKK